VIPTKEDVLHESAFDGCTEEEGTDEEDQDPTRTAKKESRGRKTDKERREAAALRDRAAGAQVSIEKMFNSRNTRQHSTASKGASTMSKGK